MICPNCGTANEPHGKFCVTCGAILGNGQNQPMKDMPSTTKTYSQNPPGSTAGAFPREHLITGEIIHWEGKPALIAYILEWTIVAIIGLILYVATLGGLLWLLVIIAGIIGDIFSTLRWWKTSFALTNRRVLTQYGIFSTKFADAHHDKIQNSVINKPFFQRILGCGEVLFATSGFSGSIKSGSARKMMTYGGGVFWDGLPHPAEVKRYAEEVIERSKAQVKMLD
jgi:hypothetical protein